MTKAQEAREGDGEEDLELPPRAILEDRLHRPIEAARNRLPVDSNVAGRY